MYEIEINGRKIGENFSPYFIAEAGVNHEGNLFLAKALANVGIWAGIDALKFQTFKTDSIVTKKANKADYQQENLGNADSQYEMLKKLELSDTNHEILMRICQENGMTFLSTPHSGEESIDYLTSLGVSAYKVGSGDLTNIPFLTYMAKKQKPIILSTGMATLEETLEAIETIRKAGNSDIVALHCTTNYPCPLDEVNLNAMNTIRREGNVLVGYSDHTQGIEIPIMATALGATVFEKHFTLDQLIKGNSPDHTSSLTPSQLKETVEAIKLIKEKGITDPIDAVAEYRIHKQFKLEDSPDYNTLITALGNGEKIPTESELKIMGEIRKSLFAAGNISTGTRLTSENTTIKRPMGGIHPRHYNFVTTNCIATENIKEDDPITPKNCNFEK